MKCAMWQALKNEVLSCNKCDLCNGGELLDGFDPHVMGEGSLNAELMFIAEAPGFNETKNKQPLTGAGASGKVFESVLDFLGLARADVYVTNTALCRPENNRDPEPFETMKCRPYLDRQIEIIQPKLIITFGRFAAQAFLNVFKITRDHGKIAKSDGLSIFPLYHPSYVKAYARQEHKEQFRQDVKKLKAILKGM